VATAPDQIYCWDITYLPTQVRGQHFYLYLFEDLFSRKAVGWQVFDCESPFEDLLAAQRWLTELLHWYNEEHHHSAISFVTPAQRHAGMGRELLKARKAVSLIGLN